ncbi:hypothetical protein TNCV_4565861 [Trichonephila clavipes]|nr:hypothetical protein TNCV_4565861 [Trichonephila clavipes]
MSSGLVPLKTRRVKLLMHVKSVEAQTTSRWCEVEVMRTVAPAQVSFSSLDHGSNLRGERLMLGGSMSSLWLGVAVRREGSSLSVFLIT